MPRQMVQKVRTALGRIVVFSYRSDEQLPRARTNETEDRSVLLVSKDRICALAILLFPDAQANTGS